MRLLVVGTGSMAAGHVKAFQSFDGVDVVGAVEIDATRRAAFADRFEIEQRFASVDEALAWGDFDAVTNVTPDAVHHKTTMPFLRAGKHVLCEKPLATNAADAAEMAQLAAEMGVINMVNLTYRNVSALQAARDAVAAGKIGAVRHLDAAYLQSWLTSNAWGDWQTEQRWLWRLSTAHGSHGVLGDVGVHIVDFASFAAGMDVTSVQAKLHTFDKAPGGKIGDYTLDANDSFAMSAAMENGALASIHASRFATGHLNQLSLRIFGTLGGIEITNDGELGTMRTCFGDAMHQAKWTEVELQPVPTNYEKFAQAVAAGQPVAPDFAHAAKLQAVLDGAMASDANGQSVAIKA